MRKLLRAIALGSATMVAVIATSIPAQANTALRDATIVTQETVGGMIVRYNADATYLATTPGAATIACNTVVVDVPIDTPTSWCWLRDLDTNEVYFAYSFPYFQSSYNAQAFVVDHPRRFQLCMYVEFTSYRGPTRCATVA